MLLFALAAFATSAGNAAAANPLAAVARGLVQCHAPDDQKRTCRSIASYEPTGGATFVNRATVLVSVAGPIVLETSTPVAIKAGAVCGSIRADDISAGHVRIAGRQATKDEAAPVLALVSRSMAALINKEICTSYVQTAAGLTGR